ncbi:MAG: NAD+ synthase [Alistipes sp.]|nr:NAD+ synthase [Alistipes sp.]
MKIAIAQLNYTVGALKSNKYKIIDSIYKAKQAGAELVVFSEHSISGANCMYILTKAQFLESCEVSLGEIASHCEDIAVIVGLPILDGNKKVSAAVLIQNRRIIKYIGKKTINSYDEKHYFDSSTGCEFLTVGGTKIAVALGDDIITEERFGDNTDIIVCVHASSYYRRHIEVRYEYLRMISFLKNKTVLFVNHVGGQAETVYDGSSCAFRNGDGIAFLKSFEEDFKIVDTDNDPPVPIPPQNHTANVYSAMKLGLHDFFEKNGFSKACLGLSGGIDSAVVLAIAVDVLGADNVRVMMLPSEFSTDHSLADAIEMAENLGVAYDVIPINESYRTMLDSLKPVIGGTSFDNTEENLQARIRCDMLMALSNKFNYILLNTSNKSELLMGYGTLYGDLSGAISIMGDVYKTEVYGLTRYINRRIQIIPGNIIRKEPSAELRRDQKDTDSLPPYELLDAVLYRLVEDNQSIYDIVEAGFDDELVSQVAERIKANEYKRRQYCPILRLSMRPCGAGYNLPLINKYILHPHQALSNSEK